jgi:ferredoxin
MIVAQRKNIQELLEIVKEHKKLLVLGCGTCVTVCLAGGEREVTIISSALRMAANLAGQSIEIEEMTIERQCDNVFIEQAAEAIARNDAGKPVYAGLNTAFMGTLEEQGIWTEKCMGCGDCVLHDYGGICPVTQCAKRLLNGPCGGSREDRCEVRADRPCGWQLIYQRLKSIGQLERLTKIREPKDWQPSFYGGNRNIVREDHRI